MATITVTQTVVSTIVSAVSSSTSAASTKVAEQAGIIEGGNPTVYSATNPIILFIIQVNDENPNLPPTCPALAWPESFVAQRPDTSVPDLRCPAMLWPIAHHGSIAAMLVSWQSANNSTTYRPALSSFSVNCYTVSLALLVPLVCAAVSDQGT
jgi:hypothetical protein